MTASMTHRKPQLHLLDAKQLSVEKLATFFTALTGREVPAAQMDEFARARRGDPQKGGSAAGRVSG
jgi:hypothetical protein